MMVKSTGNVSSQDKILKEPDFNLQDLSHIGYGDVNQVKQQLESIKE